MQDIDQRELAFRDKIVDGKVRVTDRCMNELALISIDRKVVLRRCQPLSGSLDENAGGSGLLLFEPHRVMTPVGSQFDHDGSLRRVICKKLLKAKFLQRLMHPAVDHKDLAEVSVIS